MHWVKLVVEVWFSFGLITILSLFLICRRAARLITSSVSDFPPDSRTGYTVKAPVQALQVPLACEMSGFAESESQAYVPNSAGV